MLRLSVGWLINVNGEPEFSILGAASACSSLKGLTGVHLRRHVQLNSDSPSPLSCSPQIVTVDLWACNSQVENCIQLIGLGVWVRLVLFFSGPNVC